MMLVIAMAVVVRPSTVVIRSIWITAVVAVVASRIIPIPISRRSVVAVTISGITEADPYASDPDRHLSVSLFCRNESESYCYQWK